MMFAKLCYVVAIAVALLNPSSVHAELTLFKASGMDEPSLNCFTKLNQTGEIATCTKSAEDKYQVSAQNGTNITVYVERACKATYDLMECVNEVACKKCSYRNAQAMITYRKMLILSLQATICKNWSYNQIDKHLCQADMSTPPHTEAGSKIAIIVALCIAIVFLIIVVISIFMCFCSKPKDELPRGQRRPTNGTTGWNSSDLSKSVPKSSAKSSAAAQPKGESKQVGSSVPKSKLDNGPKSSSTVKSNLGPGSKPGSKISSGTKSKVKSAIKTAKSKVSQVKSNKSCQTAKSKLSNVKSSNGGNQEKSNNTYQTAVSHAV